MVVCAARRRAREARGAARARQPYAVADDVVRGRRRLHHADPVHHGQFTVL